MTNADSDGGKHDFEDRKVSEIKNRCELSGVSKTRPFEYKAEKEADECSQLEAIGKIKPSQFVKRSHYSHSFLKK